jgi:hypothetical protein
MTGLYQLPRKGLSGNATDLIFSVALSDQYFLCKLCVNLIKFLNCILRELGNVVFNRLSLQEILSDPAKAQRSLDIHIVLTSKAFSRERQA